ncbi:MAG: tetratricopeptide repeat protein [Flavobacteriia bacterium]|nr:tetratricopeptide repeat protein [Flavobacteriia bacterium]
MLENISDINLKEQFKNNDKLKKTTYIVGGLVVLVLGFFLYKQFIVKPANEKSKGVYYAALNLADKDSTDAAIESLTPLVKNYDGKIGGEISQFVLARQYMAKRQFAKALEELEGVDVSDTYVSAMAIGLQGDCKSELGNNDEALDLYLEAAKSNENELTTPMYLFKAALVAENLKEFEKASELYIQIKENYTEFARQKTIEKYIARTKNVK